MLYLLFLLPLVVGQFFPLTKNGEIPKDIEPYVKGQPMFMDCNARHIDNGEHKMDAQENLVYVPFGTCKETGFPLRFNYDTNEDFNCTITFDDEMYHLFQLYMHDDVPFSCRIPISTEQHYMEKGGAYIPFIFNFRGEIHDSHLDIDPGMNVLFVKPKKNELSTIISGVSFGSSTNVTRIVIGDELTLNFAVRWFDNLNPLGSVTSGYKASNGLPFVDGFYNFPLNMLPLSSNSFIVYMVLVAMVSGMISLAISYNLISGKFKAKHIVFDQESKRD